MTLVITTGSGNGYFEAASQSEDRVIIDNNYNAKVKCNLEQNSLTGVSLITTLKVGLRLNPRISPLLLLLNYDYLSR